MGGLLVLVMIAAMVIWILPHSEIPQNTADIVSPPPQVTSIQEPASDKAEQGGVKAEQLLGDWLRLQARAEADDIAAWGADRYPAILAEAALGDRKYQEKQFGESEAAYQKSISDLNDLLASKEGRLLTAIENGEQALIENDRATASENFNMALIIDPLNGQARRGLEWANKLDQVLIL